MRQKRKKVLIGMSGGVDSSVSAVLLLERGYEVVGAFMKNWTSCQWKEDRRDAMRVAAKLGIEFVTLDFEKEYREKVVENLFEEYAAGRTPNPDVLCNKYVKFDLFVRAADELGCELVATGHYAAIADYQFDNHPLPLLKNEGDKLLCVPKDLNKDQTYFLWAMPREVLSRVVFPLANLTKPEVRDIARAHNLSVAEKKDSVGICFVGEVEIEAFLKERISENPGDIKTTGGRVVGRHNGLAYYTIGQRHGIGIRGGEPPYYVVRKDINTNTLFVGTEVDPELFSQELTAKDVNWLTESFRHQVEENAEEVVIGTSKKFCCLARIRYRQPLQKVQVEILNDGRIHVVFNEQQRAITPGQSIVLYDESGVVLGGGVIE